MRFSCVCRAETGANLFCTMGNIKDKQAGSLYRNFIAHVERDEVLKLVSRNEEFCCVAVLFSTALIRNVSNKIRISPGILFLRDEKKITVLYHNYL